jgi:hypothetical protein
MVCLARFIRSGLYGRNETPAGKFNIPHPTVKAQLKGYHTNPEVPNSTKHGFAALHHAYFPPKHGVSIRISPNTSHNHQQLLIKRDA